jgi:photosystem II stability/assembly factor-like uncharacterized protein
MTRLYLATGERFGRVDDAAVNQEPAWALDGSGAQCLAVDPRDPDVIYVGCRGGGLMRSTDGGRSWQQPDLPEADVFSVAVSAADGAVYAGTEPSRLFRSRDGGESFEELTALQEISSRDEWSFPPRPWTSHVRSVAPDPYRADRVLVGIELGGLMYTEDDGATFSDHRPGAQRDVHTLAWHPTAQGRAYEAAGGGAAWSRDGGRTWEAADDGRDRNYVWALAPDPADADRWLISAAAGPRRAHGDDPADAAIYRWSGDGPWEELASGLPVPLDSMPYALSAAGPDVFAGLRSGQVYRSRDRGSTWERLPVDVGAVLALAAVDGEG